MPFSSSLSVLDASICGMFSVDSSFSFRFHRGGLPPLETASVKSLLGGKVIDKLSCGVPKECGEPDCPLLPYSSSFFKCDGRECPQEVATGSGMTATLYNICYYISVTSSLRRHTY